MLSSLLIFCLDRLVPPGLFDGRAASIAIGVCLEAERVRLKGGSLTGSYSRMEVIWLLSLTRSDAIYLDEGWRDSCACLVAERDQTTLSADGPQVPTLARWSEVHHARQTIVDSKQAVATLQLRAGGFSERALARLSDRSRLAVHQQWVQTVDEIVAALGGEEHSTPVLDHVDSCLACGEHPRVRLEAVRRRVKGGFETIASARMASVCVDCLTPGLLPRVAGWEPDAPELELGTAA